MATYRVSTVHLPPNPNDRPTVDNFAEQLTRAAGDGRIVSILPIADGQVLVVVEHAQMTGLDEIGPGSGRGAG